MGYNDERDQTLNQLLTELDGFEGREGVLLLAATNRLDVLDPAVTRPGRISRKVWKIVKETKVRVVKQACSCSFEVRARAASHARCV